MSQRRDGLCNAFYFDEGSTFRREIPLQLQGAKSKPNKIRRETSNRLLSFPSASAFSCLFDPEDVGDVFFRNVGLSPNCTAL
jgi:hypothetical protein